MIINFNEHFGLSAAEVYSYFDTPADWTRLYGLAGDPRDLGGGWYAIALKRFPFPLVARNTEQQPNELVRWVFRGFWRGRGEVRFSETADGVRVEGFEEISVRPLYFLSPYFERLFLEDSFHAIWEIGWHRLRKRESTMECSSISSRLDFLRKAERLKDTLRSAYTTGGRTESVAEHTWRLTLLAITFADELPDVDLLKLLKICVLHDLGEAVDGDIPAPLQSSTASKSEKERRDFVSLVEPLPDEVRSEFVSLWDEYEGGESTEARVAKALDKLETILQHNQGLNPEDFDYEFNLDYGKTHTDRVPIAAAIRDLLDADTRARAGQTAHREEPSL